MPGNRKTNKRSRGVFGGRSGSPPPAGGWVFEERRERAPNIFPILGKRAKNFSNHWKNGRIFPTIGKNVSNHWKMCGGALGWRIVRPAGGKWKGKRVWCPRDGRLPARRRLKGAPHLVILPSSLDGDLFYSLAHACHPQLRQERRRGPRPRRGRTAKSPLSRKIWDKSSLISCNPLKHSRMKIHSGE